MKPEEYISSLAGKPWVCLGVGGSFAVARKFFCLAFNTRILHDNAKTLRIWKQTGGGEKGYNGRGRTLTYFVPLDSDIARLNGHFPVTTEVKKKIKL